VRVLPFKVRCSTVHLGVGVYFIVCDFSEGLCRGERGVFVCVDLHLAFSVSRGDTCFAGVLSLVLGEGTCLAVFLATCKVTCIFLNTLGV